MVAGAAFLIPTLHADHGMTLSAAATVTVMPSIGMTLTLLAWGALADRVGERAVLAAGALLSGAALLGAAAWWPRAAAGTGLAAAPVAVFAALLLLAGVGAASANAASGRVVVGWFPPRRRGLAMGVRQTAQPLGVALGALTVPVTAQAHGVGPALLAPAALSLAAAAACALWVLDPPRPAKGSTAHAAAKASPYRGGGGLWRIHAVAVLLVVPQVALWAYILVWLITDRGWSTAAAGALVAATQVLGAAGRLAAGAWSDRVGSRTAPVRAIAAAAALSLLALAATDWRGWAVAVGLMMLASVVTVADNGLLFTAAAEAAGPLWGGRVLGAHNTAQHAVGALVPPAFGAAVAAAGFPAAFAALAVFAVAAVPVVPRAPSNRT